MSTVGIVGAGITGLTAAFYLERAGVPVTVYEASPYPGGMIRTSERDGFIVENGPNTIMESNADVPALVTDLGLDGRRLAAAPESKSRYIVRDGEMVRLPQSLMGGVKTPLLSFGAKLRICAEPFIGKGTIEDEALAAFVKRRLGPEVLDYCIDPFVGGVYAGEPARLSVRHGFPKLYALEQKYGSLIRGAILGARERKKRDSRSKTDSPMLTFDRGLGVVIEATQNKLGPALRLNTPVNALRREADGWRVETAGGSEIHSSMLLTVPAHCAATMNIEGVDTEDFQPVEEVFYPPIARVAVALAREHVLHPLDGFGVLIPSKEHMNCLGILFSSSLYTNRAPHGKVLLTAFLGGSRQKDILNASDDGLVDLAMTDARKLLGAFGQPVFRDVLRIPRAIPQYNVGYGVVKNALDRIEAKAPGVFIAANYRNGISVADCIASGKAASEKLQQYAASAPRLQYA